MAVFVVVTALVSVLVSSALAYAGPSWLMYHGDAARTGNDTTEPALLPIGQAWAASLDGKVFAQPLVLSGRVIAVTENDTVYALDAHDGRVLWSRSIGVPMTNVVAQVGCGNIDPLGITSTPVIDAATNTVFVVGAIQDANKVIHHQLVGLDALTGTVRVSANADPGAPQNALYIQQRAGLAIGNGRVYIGYGGYSGDCGPYHGWVVSLDESGLNKVVFNVTPHTGLGAIWATSGPAIDAGGNVYVATGNPDPIISTQDYGESVVKLDATLHVVGVLPTFPGGDNDLGSSGPILLPNNMLFQIGKFQTGFLVDTNTMGVLQSLPVCVGEVFGAVAFDGSRLFVPCTEGIREVNVNVANRSMSLGWTGPAATNDSRCSDFLNNCGTEPPTIAGGVVWTIDRGTGLLRGLDPATGAVRTPFQLGGLPHFASPSAALGLLLIGTNAGVTALDGPSGPPPPVATSCPCSIWPVGVPAVASATDVNAVEVGVKFRSDVAGSVTGVRFYKGSGNTGTHVGSVWSSGGGLLASAQFSGESATGWQTVTFASPVSVAAGVTYVASYHTNVGHYAYTQGGLSSQVDSGPLHALASGASGGNGVYAYGAGSQFPTAVNGKATNYWVDITFVGS